MTTANTLAALVNSSSQVVVPSGGIQFADATNASGSTVSNQSNLIEQDGYEEGTFSPSITGWTGSYGTQNGYYTKIGRLVHIYGEVIVSVGTGSFGSTYPGLNSIPFVGNTVGSDIGGTWIGTGSLNGNFPTNSVGSGPLDAPSVGGSSAFPNLTRIGAGVGNFQASWIDTSVAWGMRFQMTYLTS